MTASDKRKKEIKSEIEGLKLEYFTLSIRDETRDEILEMMDRTNAKQLSEDLKNQLSEEAIIDIENNRQKASAL